MWLEGMGYRQRHRVSSESNVRIMGNSNPGQAKEARSPRRPMRSGSKVQGRHGKGRAAEAKRKDGVRK